MVGHRLMCHSLLFTGEFVEARSHYDRAIGLYDPAAPLLGSDGRVALRVYRSCANWLLGYPEAALSDAESAVHIAREIGQATSLLTALAQTAWTHIQCGNYEAAEILNDEVICSADEKGTAFWKAYGTLNLGPMLALNGEASEAVKTINIGMTSFRSTGATIREPLHLSYLAKAYAELGQFDEAWGSISEALTGIKASKETVWKAEANRVAGEIALKSPVPDTAKAEAYLEHALSVAREQQAKSWELRAAMSMARLWRDQGKPQQASELLAPVYGWFTEGFDTRDLKEAKALLEELTS
jgi:predicted ATPase